MERTSLSESFLQYLKDRSHSPFKDSSMRAEAIRTAGSTAEGQKFSAIID